MSHQLDQISLLVFLVQLRFGIVLFIVCVNCICVCNTMVHFYSHTIRPFKEPFLKHVIAKIDAWGKHRWNNSTAWLCRGLVDIIEPFLSDLTSRIQPTFLFLPLAFYLSCTELHDKMLYWKTMTGLFCVLLVSNIDPPFRVIDTTCG